MVGAKIKKHMTEGRIQQALRYKYSGTAKYMVTNAYVFGDLYGETDFFISQKKSGYCYDIEVKISKHDFKADFKKRYKHEILSTGQKTLPMKRYNFEAMDRVVDHKFRPNKFYYCVPKGLIDVTDIPAYAGLMYINEWGDIRTVKEAPFLHREKLDIERVLCEKFYYYWRKAETELSLLRKKTAHELPLDAF